MIDVTPASIAIQLGPIPVYWYGICYAIGLAVAYLVMQREVVRRHEDPDVLANGIIIVAVAALVGGRLYHVIDQWQQLYRDDPIRVFLPPYTGLGVYGGLITGTLAAVWYARRRHVQFWRWADIVAPGLFAMQAIGRWGNFFNQELYGAPTTLPWGIAIDCQHRIVEYPCSQFPLATTHFQPLFLYESVSGLIGLVVLLLLARRAATRLRTGDLLAIFFIWYGIVRFSLETLRLNNWFFFSIPTAQLFSLAFIAAGIAILIVQRRRGAATIAESDSAAAAMLVDARATEVADDEGEDDDEDDGDDEDGRAPDRDDAVPDVQPGSDGAGRPPAS